MSNKIRGLSKKLAGKNSSGKGGSGKNELAGLVHSIGSKFQKVISTKLANTVKKFCTTNKKVNGGKGVTIGVMANMSMQGDGLISLTGGKKIKVNVREITRARNLERRNEVILSKYNFQ